MDIYFYLNNEEETLITFLYDVESNPFVLNDIIYLNVEALYPKDYDKFKEDFRNQIIKANKILEKIFKNKKEKLVKERKCMELNTMKKQRLTMEYHCNLID